MKRRPGRPIKTPNIRTQRRERAGLTLRELAELAGVTRHAVHRWDRGEDKHAEAIEGALFRRETAPLSPELDG